MNLEQAKLPPPPGLIASLAAGFESVASRITVIALPVLLDLFLWFGPQVRVQAYTRPWLEQLPVIYKNLAGTADLEVAQQFWTDILQNLNIFAALRTFPVGLSSLMASEMPTHTPLGGSLAYEAGSFLGIIGWGALSALTGWLIGAFYFYWVSKVSLQPGARPLLKSILQSVLLALIWAVLLFAVGMPVLMLVSLTTMLNPTLGQVAMFAAGVALLWLVVPVYFSAHGIFTYQMNALKAILASLRMIRYTLPTTFFFLLLLTLLSQGLRFLWVTPAQDSWWMLVGILGHAFISTALLAASFIYYRDVNNWLKVVFEQMKKQVKPVNI